jgi:hypothetical protein
VEALALVIWPGEQLLEAERRLGESEVCTGVCTGRAFAPSLTHPSRSTMRFPRSGAAENAPGRN